MSNQNLTARPSADLLGTFDKLDDRNGICYFDVGK